MTFEKYLQDKHADQYQGLDDEMPDNFSEWLEDMGPDEMIEYAEKWHEAQLAPLREVWEKEGTTMKYCVEAWDKDYINLKERELNLNHKVYRVFCQLAKQEGWDNQTG